MALADVDELVGEIRREAGSEQEKVLAEALARVKEIRSRAEELIRRLDEEAARKLEAAVSAERERTAGALRIEENRLRLEARRAALARAFELARRRIEELSGAPGYRLALERLAREAIEAVGDAGELVVAPSDVDSCRALLEKLGSRASVRGQEGGKRGTVIALSKDGLRTVDNSLSTRLERAEQTWEEEIARILFGAAPAHRGGP